MAGVPPDDWSASGQLWGNPIYDWDTMRATGYRWWIERFRRTFELVDLSRIDHFRAFVAYWAVPARNRTAAGRQLAPRAGPRGLRRRAPGLGDLPLIAEDLGVITGRSSGSATSSALPGMVILQFAFSENMNNPQPISSIRRNRVIYTGTHDNPTTAQWWQEASATERERRSVPSPRPGSTATHRTGP